jgi:hypothetical protein
VKLVADNRGNNDGRVSADEWDKVYRECGLNSLGRYYDSIKSNPLEDLTAERMISYLNKTD